MEYRLNKIDMDLRKQINEAAKEGKVHGNKQVSINKDKKEEQKDSNSKQKFKNFERYNKKKLLVDAEKAEQLEIDAYLEKDKDLKGEKGIFLDTRK